MPPAERGPARSEWALILGGAAGVWEDVLAWERIYGRQWDGLVVAANDVGCHWPRELHHWVSLHPAKFKKWCPLRERQGLPGGYVVWGRSLKMPDGVIVHRELKAWAGGSSGMFAVQVAREVGCTRAVLCGIPMTPTPHFEENQEGHRGDWKAAAGHWRAWGKCEGLMKGWVRSMSGRTRELLGAPTLEWLLAP